MYSKTYSSMLSGIDADLISVEVQVSKGIPNFLVIGLVSKAILEAKERVSSAMSASGFPIPPKRVLVSLSPADLRKDGPQFDLAISASLMQALGYLELSLDFMAESCFIAELSITGALKSVRGILALVFSAIKEGKKNIFVAEDALSELLILTEDEKLLAEVNVFLIRDLSALIAVSQALHNGVMENKVSKQELIRSKCLQYFSSASILAEPLFTVADGRRFSAYGFSIKKDFGIDFNDIVGQELAKRALEIALAGRHHLLMVGPPGCGKSMLAKSALALVEDLSFQQCLENRMISDLAHIPKSDEEIEKRFPFRSPHNASSAVSIIGGGVPISPGEVSLAHNGILFMDEFAEFDRFTIDQLRTVLDNAKVFLNKGNQKIVFPANFLLIAASNPCPCGYSGDKEKVCICNPIQIQRYQAKISGPILDRIDIYVKMTRLSKEEVKSLSSSSSCDALFEKTSSVKKRIKIAKSFAAERLLTLDLDKESQMFLNEAVFKLDLSSRSHKKVILLARTIANLEECEHIQQRHIAEALAFIP